MRTRDDFCLGKRNQAMLPWPVEFMSPIHRDASDAPQHGSASGKLHIITIARPSTSADSDLLIM
jgi:hypothetical protein